MLFFLLAAFVPQDAPSMSASEAPKVNICMTKPEGKLDSFDAALSAMERELEAERARQAPDMDIENDDESLDEEDAELLATSYYKWISPGKFATVCRDDWHE